MEAFAGRSALDATARPVIELMEAGLQLDGQVGRRGLPLEGALVQSGFEVADALFHGAVVARVSRWIVKRQDPVSGEDLIDLFAVEGRAVVAFEEQGRAMLLEGGLDRKSVV